MRFSTADLGIALRDHLEGHTISTTKCLRGEHAGRGRHPVEVQDEVEFVDVSDPHNPILFIAGQAFQIHIVAVAGE